MNEQSVIEMTGITKSFPGAVANDHVDFDLQPGEIHALLGENGAGKTTLMSILTGMHQPDAGTINVQNRKVKIRSPRDSQRLGIGMVYQHFTLIPNLTVIENFILGFEGGFILKLKEATQKLRQICEGYGLSIDPFKKIHDLSVSERQKTEILKILFHESNVLILDEPTSLLTPSEAENFFHTIKLLRSAGKSVVLITHKVSEALAVSDRITIMRSGKVAAELSTIALMAQSKETAADTIFHHMFEAVPRSMPAIPEKAFDDEPVLELKEVAALNSRGAIGLKRISLNLRKGEIIGIAGVDNEIQRLLAEVIGGQKPISAGKLLYRGQDITQMDVAKRFALGISYITDDRINEGCAPSMTLAENAIQQTFHWDRFSRFGILNALNITAFASDLIKRFGIRTTGPEAQVRALSGGNIQKFLLARSLSAKPNLIVCNNPTYGLDVRTVRAIRDLLREQSRRGISVLLISSDIEDLFTCSDRIGVLFNGKIAGILKRHDATVEKIGKLMVGIRE